MEVILILTGILTFFWAVFKFRRRHIEMCGKEIPGDKAFPLIGNMLQLLKAKQPSDVYNLVFDLMKRYGKYGICRFWAGYFLVVGISDPKYIEAIANSPNAIAKGPLLSALFHHLPKGVFITNDIPKWKKLRKPLTKTLTRKNLEGEYHSIFVNKNKKFEKFIKEKRRGKEFDIKIDLEHLKLDILSQTLLGVETNEVEERKFNFFHYVSQFCDASITIGAMLNMFKVFGFLKLITRKSTLKMSEMAVRRFISWIFEERLMKSATQVKGNLLYYPDFLLRRKIEENLTMDDIERELVDVLFAGSETSGIASSCALLFLAMFPEIQEEAYREQVYIFGENSTREPTPEDLTSMVYLTRVVKEAIRFCSPALIVKYATGDIQLDNYTIPKGTVIIIGIDVVCFDERYWEKPRTFYPDHFLPEKEAERPTFAYPVFGCGARICPGIQYGMISVKTTLSSILRNFKVTTSMKFEDISFIYRIMREFTSYEVKFEERIRPDAGVS